MSKDISAPNFELSTLIELLHWRANQHPDRRVYTFLADGETERGYLTFAELDRQARAIGALLQGHVESGARALLIYPPGLEFITALFGCLCSGIIAVPIYPPSSVRSDRALARFRAIANDAQPSVALTTLSISSKIQDLLAQAPELQSMRLLITDNLASTLAEQWLRPRLRSEALAVLQYTSGSTGIPKGVMLTHRALLHNLSLIRESLEFLPESRCVSWLPLYHDMGLIGGVLEMVYAGASSTLMSPTAFLQRPLRWLQAISRTRATLSGGPNFAYDLCVRKIPPEQREGLDLSSWSIASCGAEPVRHETLERFVEAFEPYGFRREALYPCYGLAEATLLVSGSQRTALPVVRTFQGVAFERNRVVEVSAVNEDSRVLVGCGKTLTGQKIVIVDPESLIQCPPDYVGEIWVSGLSIARGYWNRSEETEHTFQAFLADTREGPFLRTGDLGFLQDGELFITGRLKDLIIIRGSNHYPQDIELTVEQSHPILRAAGSAAFSVDVAGEERLVVVQEVERQYLKSNMDEAFGNIRQAIAEQHELQVYAVILVKPGSVPKTSSGKIQRRACKEAFLTGQLDVVGEWIQRDLEVSKPQTLSGERNSIPISLPEKQVLTDIGGTSFETYANEQESLQKQSRPTQNKTAAAIQAWLISQISERLKVDLHAIDVQEPFARYGMDSVQAVTIAADLETWLGQPLSPTLIYDYPSIEALARHLAAEPLTPTMAISTEPDHKANTHPETETDAIAIIGIGCRFPRARDPQGFWELLRDGIDGITEIPAERWDLYSFYDPNPATPAKMNTRWGGFLEQVDQFDSAFFRISPREAAHMDPQQRLLLEVAWEALENAGQAPETLAGSQTGVFIGISSNDYSLLQLSNLSRIDAYVGTGGAHSIAANRLSYLLDLRGPSLAVDTACSSSLAAIHLACQSLRNGECNLAIAGGVNLLLSPELTVTFSQARMMSSDGRCKTFDEAADGYVRAEGCGLVVLKPQREALRDGDNILALILGSALNQDGRSNGLTAPNGLAQEAVIRRALQNARVEPDQISYVETHGSSTPLGDPIEFASLKAVLMQNRPQSQPCALSSVKTNIGHLEAAAGVAGLIKTVLCLQKREIPPHLHLKKLNPHISLADTTFFIPTERQPWSPSARRLAGVSAFGFGGTNVHVILEEAPAATTGVPNALTNEVERPLHVLTLSAQSENALRALASRYEAFLAAQPEVSVADVCFTANTGRSHFAQRLAITADSSIQLRERLAAFEHDQSGSHTHKTQSNVGTGLAPVREVVGVAHGQQSRVVFLFTGQGSQYPGMGRQLYDTQPTFRKVLDTCDRILRSYLEQPLLSVLYPAPGVSSPLHETAYSQPALFALEYALAELWRSWGIEPDVVMGHSVGEYVAACVAGMFSLEDGLKLIAERGRLMQGLSQQGEMAVVFADQAQLATALSPFREQVAIAAVNGPKNTVISGERKAIHSILRRLESEGLTTHPMEVSHAFHSPLMDPILDTFEQVARQVHFEAPRLPLISNLTGQTLKPGEFFDASYWRRQTRETVQFSTGMRTLAEEGYDFFVEIGPTPTLLSIGRRCLPDGSGILLPSLRKGQNDWQMLLNTIASLYVNGVNLDWKGFDRDYTRRRLSLPTYPFERQYCWLETEELEKASNLELNSWAPSSAQRHPLLGAHIELAHPARSHMWEIEVDKQRLPYLGDHRIQGAIVVPVSVYLEMAQAAAVEAFGSPSPVLAEVELKKLLLLPEEGSQRVQVILSYDTNENVCFYVYSHVAGVSEQSGNAWMLHASGKIR